MKIIIQSYKDRITLTPPKKKDKVRCCVGMQFLVDKNH